MENTYQSDEKTYQYLRSIKKLMARSPDVQIQLQNPYSTWSDINKTLENLFTLKGFNKNLDIIKLIHSLSKMGLGPKTSYTEKKSILNIFTRKKYTSKIIKTTQEYLQNGGKQARAANWQWRLEQAIKTSINDGWFPLFGTYTVDPKTLPKDCLTRDDLWQNTPAWDRFVKKFKTEIADSCGYGRKPSKWPLGHTYFQYFAIIEHGASGDHPHIHVIWLCKNIPSSWKTDPNQNCIKRLNTDIPPASSLWKHGIQRKTMPLFIIGSWFTNNWKIPHKPDTLEPIKVGDAGAVAGYIGKYLTKGDTKKWNHRVKATKNLGIQTLISKLKQETSLILLLALATRPSQYITWMKIQTSTQLPLSLLREKSKQELMKRLHSTKTQRAKLYLMTRWTRTPTSFYSSLVTLVKNGLRPWKMNSKHRYNAYTPILEEVPNTVHSEARTELIITWLRKEYQTIKTCEKFTLLQGI